MRSAFSKALREPLVHFVLLAAALFLAASLFAPDDDLIEVSREELDWRILQVEAREGSPLSPEERRLVEEAYIDERVLIREARAMGLDQDERIDDILVQKMLHVLSGEVIQPTEEELEAYYEEHRERYATASSVTVDELVLAPDQMPSRDLDDESAGATDAGVIARRTMERLTLDDLEQLFGASAAEAAFAAASGIWVDAGVSARGRHWIRVRDRFDAQVPPLHVVRDFVRADWIAEQEQARLLELVAELRTAYTVVVEGREAQP